MKSYIRSGYLDMWPKIERIKRVPDRDILSQYNSKTQARLSPRALDRIFNKSRFAFEWSKSIAAVYSNYLALR